MTGAPGPHDLGQDHARQRLGVLLGQRAGEGHRGHRARQRERRDAHDLVALGEGHDPLEHRRVEPQRGARVDDREDRRLVVERRVRRTPRAMRTISRHVDVPLPARGCSVDRLVHQRQRVVGGVEVADAVVDVDRLDRVARQEVDRVERLAEAQQVLVVLAVADPPTAVEVRHVRRAADGPERHPVAAEPEVVRPGSRRGA